ncbi:MAG TPA: hypothetical protein VJ553_01415 [Candidatus Paceibacterota bacterium]|nr:hypothetical protein [Candidatus Paceibacterota bacterium]
MKTLRRMWATAPLMLAQATPLGETGGISYNRLIAIVYALVKILLQVGEFAAVGFIVWYGLRMVMSKGDSTKFSAARKGLLLALLGAVIIFGAYVIVDSVQGAVESIGG